MMRSLKKLLYGLLYLSIFGGILTAVYFIYFNPKPSCEDGILNQNEEQIDCGGSCISCEIKDFELSKGEINVFEVGKNKTTLVAIISNPNQNYVASKVRYTIRIKSVIGGQLGIVEGETSIYPGEDRYIIESGLSFDSKDAGKIDFEIMDGFELLPKETAVDYEILIRQPKIELTENATKAKGVVTNISGRDTTSIKLSALIFDKEGKLINAGSTILNNLGAFKSDDFDIFMPLLDISLEDLDVEILWEVLS
ncbi:MAG: hypothetical protein ABH880_00260 [Patescibacteria group bacterium]